MKAPVTVAQAWAVVSEHYGFCVQAAQPVEWSCPDTGRTCTAEDCDKSCVQQAQPVGPVAWRKWDADVESWDFAQYQNAPAPGWLPLYTTPPDHTAELARLREVIEGYKADQIEGIQIAARQQAEINALREAVRVGLEALEGVLDKAPGQAAQFWSVSGGTYEAVQCNNAITKMREVL